MSHEALLDKLFRGERLTHDEYLQIFRALSWRLHWPFVDVIADALRTGKRADWPEGFPESAQRIEQATALLRPLFDQWKASRGV